MCSGVEHMWLIAKTKPNQEKRARFNLENQGFTAYLPMIETKKFKNNLWLTNYEVFFRGYIFIKTDALDNFTKINNTLGLSILLINRVTLTPQVVSESIVNEIKSRLVSLTSGPLSLKKYDKVQIINGSVRELHAIFIEKISSKRSKLLINILNKKIFITAPNSDIQFVL